MTKTYLELIQFTTFEERYEYLKLSGRVGEDTFGWDRYLNQALYHSEEWRQFRRRIIVRDNGCDLGVEGFEIQRGALIHHINPITVDDVLERRSCIFDPNNVITTTQKTHNAIHYGSTEPPIAKFAIRTAGDTCPWKR